MMLMYMPYAGKFSDVSDRLRILYKVTNMPIFIAYQTQFPQNHQYLTSLFSTESGASLAQSLDKILRHQDDPSAVQVISNAPSA